MSMPWHEDAVQFHCEAARLIGIIATPDHPAQIGVVIVVGGPQYRAGSHRQFSLLARHLAAQGIASIRFDYRGMGDSEGETRPFTAIDADIRAAVDTLQAHLPGLQRIALWGLCDAASAILYYASLDARVTQLILLNPWVHTESLRAQAHIRHYYLQRLLQRDFWRKLGSGKIALAHSLSTLIRTAGQVLRRRLGLNASPSGAACDHADYICRMGKGLEAFEGNALLILSGNDLTAQEFQALCKQDPHWHRLTQPPKVSLQVLPQANHTFSTREWRDTVAGWTAQWLNEKKI